MSLCATGRMRPRSALAGSCAWSAGWRWSSGLGVVPVLRELPGGSVGLLPGWVFGPPLVELVGLPEQCATRFDGRREAVALAHEDIQGSPRDAQVGGGFVAVQVAVQHGQNSNTYMHSGYTVVEL